MASLWLQVPEATVRSFFHDPTGKSFVYLFWRIKILFYFRQLLNIFGV